MTKQNDGKSAISIRPMCGAIRVDGKRMKVSVFIKDRHASLEAPSKDVTFCVSAYDYGCTPLWKVFDGVKNESDPYTDYFDNDYAVVAPGSRNYDIAYATYVKTQIHRAKISIRRFEKRLAQGRKLYSYEDIDKMREYLHNLENVELVA